MNATRFLDTNIILYAYDQQAGRKRDIALELVKQGWAKPGDIALSVQVLQELYVNLVRRGVASSAAAEIIRDFSHWPVVDNTVDLLLAALTEQSRWQLSLWDALILTAARNCGVRELISEDFSHNQDYGGIRVRNPFR
jgi:predicted nucleic acid-binding protein